MDVSVAASPIRDASGKIVGTARIIRDITALKEREREVARLSRLYAALSQVNQAIVWTPSRGDLFQKVCQVLVEHGGFRMVWIGWYEPDTHRIVPVADYGDEKGFLQTAIVYGDNRPEGHGPTGTAFRTGQPCISNDMLADPKIYPWRSELTRRKLRAAATFPIRIRGTVRGTLSVYADSVNYFHDREIALLEEAATDVSFALDNFEREEARSLAEQKVHDEKRFTDTMIESMPGILYFYISMMPKAAFSAGIGILKRSPVTQAKKSPACIRSTSSRGWTGRASKKKSRKCSRRVNLPWRLRSSQRTDSRFHTSSPAGSFTSEASPAWWESESTFQTGMKPKSAWRRASASTGNWSSTPTASSCAGTQTAA